MKEVCISWVNKNRYKNKNPLRVLGVFVFCILKLEITDNIFYILLGVSRHSR